MLVVIVAEIYLEYCQLLVIFTRISSILFLSQLPENLISRFISTTFNFIFEIMEWWSLNYNKKRQKYKWNKNTPKFRKWSVYICGVKKKQKKKWKKLLQWMLLLRPETNTFSPPKQAKNKK